MDSAWLSKTQRVEEIVQRTEALKWWIDSELAKGKSDEEIAEGLPVAWAFITGKHSVSDLLEVAMSKRRANESA